MAEERVEVIGHVAAAPDAVWAVVGDFAGRWHPLVDEMRAERGGRGALVRAFRAGGEDTLYREQLTYRSDSDRVLAYTHLEGIRGAEAYDADLAVLPAEAGGSRIEWRARILAPAGRAEEIAAGTRAIFESGLAALDPLPAPADAAGRQDNPGFGSGDATLETLLLRGQPDLAVTVTPPKPGPLLLFLHGIGGGRTNWLPQLRAAGRHCRAAALDLRGYGHSQLGNAPSTIEDYCADIDRVADQLGAERLILCGLSYGSWIATSYAMRRAERLAGLVLSGGCTGMSEAGAEEREAFRTAREVPLNAGRTPADFAPAVVDVLAGPDAGPEMRETLRASMAAIPAATYRDALGCFTRPPERFDFSRLTMPVLMMTGEFDRLASPAEIRGVSRRILAAAPRPSVRFEVIARAGHVCNLEQPAAFNRLLCGYLDEVVR